MYTSSLRWVKLEASIEFTEPEPYLLMSKSSCLQRVSKLAKKCPQRQAGWWAKKAKSPARKLRLPEGLCMTEGRFYRSQSMSHCIIVSTGFGFPSRHSQPPALTHSISVILKHVPWSTPSAHYLSFLKTRAPEVSTFYFHMITCFPFDSTLGRIWSSSVLWGHCFSITAITF